MNVINPAWPDKMDLQEQLPPATAAPDASVSKLFADDLTKIHLAGGEQTEMKARGTVQANLASAMADDKKAD